MLSYELCVPSAALFSFFFFERTANFNFDNPLNGLYVVWLSRILVIGDSVFLLFGFVFRECMFVLGRFYYLNLVWGGGLYSFILNLVDPRSVTVVRDCYLGVSLLKLCWF